jgi:inosose dehydratase
MRTSRIAGAPISWGVCEVPGWGYQLSSDQVLREMHEVGLAATEFGPEGFLPTAPAEAARVLEANHLSAVGGFMPVVLHQPAHDPVPGVESVLDTYEATGANVLVLAAVSGRKGYDARPVLEDEGWVTLLHNLQRLSGVAASRGVRAVLHPHVGTMVETGKEVQRVLDGSSVPLCLDTGHLLIGGSDPAELAQRAPGRIAHAHLKDVDSSMADQVRAGDLRYTEAVRKGMYRPLGQGDVDVASIVGSLERAGYDGWYVLEQDTILSAEPVDEGPVADVKASFGYVSGLLVNMPGRAAGPARATRDPA